jgi:hypothetical protein
MHRLLSQQCSATGFPRRGFIPLPGFPNCLRRKLQQHLTHWNSLLEHFSITTSLALKQLTRVLELFLVTLSGPRPSNYFTDWLTDWLTDYLSLHPVAKLKIYDRRSVGQSVLVSDSHLKPMARFLFSDWYLLVSWCGAPSLTRRWVCNLLVQLHLGPSRGVTLGLKSYRTDDHILLPHMKLPQAEGPGSRIYISQEQSGQVMPPGTGFTDRRLLRLAGLGHCRGGGGWIVDGLLHNKRRMQQYERKNYIRQWNVVTFSSGKFLSTTDELQHQLFMQNGVR